ncbi:serine protease [Salipiger bermudensis]|uniref:trypsin-like serine peptidase n=1 Tax=Salipiger bermudensis TaxID=344736 RepID=UPI001C99C802|nr:serine protease [Salipiger bermudensis]MBY6006699.1 serine protease [Salipiger bermudensis]
MKPRAVVLGLLVVGFGLASVPGMAQQLAEASRERVVPAGDYVIVAEVGGGKSELLIAAPSVVTGTWRFWIRLHDASSDLVIRDPADGRTVASMPVDRLASGDWSPYLDILTAVMEVPTAAMVEVRMIGFPQVALGTQTPVGALNLTPVLSSDIPFRVRRLNKAVGHLSILEGRFGEAQDTYYTYCTAFMIAPSHALTAHHCVERGLEGRYAKLVMGFVDETAPDGAGRHEVAIMAQSRALDVALLAVTPPVPAAAAFRLADQEPEPERELLVYQHFEGAPMAVSQDADCLTTGNLFDGPFHIKDGTGHNEAGVVFGHGCDTTKSSSGAPVVDRHTLLVVGLHQRGYGVSGAQENRALRLDALRTFVTQSLETDR